MGNAASSSSDSDLDNSDSDGEKTLEESHEELRDKLDFHHLQERCMTRIVSGLGRGRQRLVKHSAGDDDPRWFAVWIDMGSATPRYKEIVALAQMDATKLDDVHDAALIPTGETTELRDVLSYSDIVAETLTHGGKVTIAGNTQGLTSYTFQ